MSKGKKLTIKEIARGFLHLFKSRTLIDALDADEIREHEENNVKRYRRI